MASILCCFTCVCVFALVAALPTNNDNSVSNSGESENKSDTEIINVNKFIKSDVNLSDRDAVDDDPDINRQLQHSRSIQNLRSFEEVSRQGNLFRFKDQVWRYKRNVVLSGVCPQGQVLKPFPFGCITCKE